MIDLFKKYKPYIFAFIFTTFVVMGGYLLYDFLTFRIVSQDPPNNSMLATSASVEITFNKPLKSIDAQKMTIEPEIAGEWLVNDKIITFMPYELFEDTEYTIHLREIISINNMSLSHSFTFTADTETEPTAKQQERALMQTDGIEQKYSVLEKNIVPYRDSNYVIEYNFPSDEEEKMILLISFTPPEYIYENKTDYDIFIKENTEAAKKYLTSNGINLDEYRIEFQL